LVIGNEFVVGCAVRTLPLGFRSTCSTGYLQSTVNSQQSTINKFILAKDVSLILIG